MHVKICATNTSIQYSFHLSLIFTLKKLFDIAIYKSGNIGIKYLDCNPLILSNFILVHSVKATPYNIKYITEHDELPLLMEKK